MIFCQEILLKHAILLFTVLISMITGAGGSIGSEIVRQVLLGNPKK